MNNFFKMLSKIHYLIYGRIYELKYLVIFCFLALIAGCSTDANDLDERSTSGHFKDLQLTEQEVFKIEVKDNNLFAGTSDGFMVFDLAKDEQTGHHKPGSSVRAFLIIDEQFWLISTAYPDGSQENVIFKSEDQGETWVYYTNGYAEDWDGERRLTPDTMDYHLGNGLPVIFAKTLPTLFIARSQDGGASWENVQGNWGNPAIGASRFIKIDKNNTDIIWAGGSGSLFNTYLIKSTNGGDDWEFVDILPDNENTVYNVTVRHQRSEHVLAGVGGGIMKSTDSGSSWETVYTGVNTYTFTKSFGNPNIIYASGMNATGSLFFLASNDFGDNWKLQEFSESPTELFVNDIVSVTEGNDEILYFGTNRGVLSFRFDE